MNSILALENMVYFNVKTKQGIETVDELNEKDFTTRLEFAREKIRLKNEYSIAGMAVYCSSRSTKEWKESR